MKVDYGAVAIIPAGQFDATKQYHVNDLVGYHGSSYIVHVQPPVGTLPTNPAYFDLHTEGSSIATSTAPGTVQPDMTTLTVDQDGILSVHQDVLDDISAANAKANDVAAKVGNVPQGNTLQSEVEGLDIDLSAVSALLGTVPSGSTLQGQIDDVTGNIGTVPSGSTLQGQIDDITGNIGTVPSGSDLQTEIDALNTGLTNISSAIQPIGNIQYGGVHTFNITNQQINTWVDVDSTLTLAAGSYAINLYAYVPNMPINARAYISIFNDLSYPLFEKYCDIKNGLNTVQDTYASITVFLRITSPYTFHPLISSNAVMSNVAIELSAIRIK